jgi:mono/diheme cytochrome c family protein
MKAAYLAIPLVLVVALLGCLGRISARIPYAKETGKKCIVCHATTRPSAGDLHWAGKYYAEKRTLKGYTPDAITSAAQITAGSAPAPAGGPAADRSLRTLRQIYQTKCSACHGPRGKGIPALNVRDFTDSAWQASRTDKEIRQAIEKGRLPLMPQFADSLDDETIQSLVKLVRQFGVIGKEKQQ